MMRANTSRDKQFMKHSTFLHFHAQIIILENMVEIGQNWSPGVATSEHAFRTRSHAGRHRHSRRIYYFITY